MNLLVDADIRKLDEAWCHISCWRSLTHKKKLKFMGCCPELRWEDRLRAIVVDCKGYFKDFKKWQSESMQLMQHLRFSDCESLVSHLQKPKSQRMELVRRSIDIQGLQQLLWKRSDGTNLDELLPDAVAENAVRWIDTSCTGVDCLTRKMKPGILLRVTNCGVLTLRPTIECQVARAEEADAAGYL